MSPLLETLGGKALDIAIGKAWEAVTNKTWAELYIDSFNTALDAQRDRLAARYAGQYYTGSASPRELVNLDREQLRACFSRDLYTAIEVTPLATLLDPGFQLRLASAMAARRVITIDGNNLSEEDYLQVCRALVAEAHSRLRATLPKKPEAIYAALLDTGLANQVTLDQIGGALNHQQEEYRKAQITDRELVATVDALREMVRDLAHELPSMTEAAHQAAVARRRQETLRFYLRDQLKQDTDLRFKEVDLKADLFDLFVDVPLSFRLPMRERRWFLNFPMYLRATAAIALLNPDDMSQVETGVMAYFRYPLAYPISVTPDASPDPVVVEEEWEERGLSIPYSVAITAFGSMGLEHLVPAGAPSFSAVARSMPTSLAKSIVEAGPGQGKSTLVQYICQIHRCRWLKLDDQLARVDPKHLEGPIKLPFKVELRDVVRWLRKETQHQTDQPAAASMGQSVEGYLAAHVQERSGGRTFSVDDFAEVLRSHPTLLVFDALDEVADPDDRNFVLAEISKMCARLQPASASLQIVVTTRPAAYSDPASLSAEGFVHLKLLPLTPELTTHYAQKWCDAKELSGETRDRTLLILSEKMAEPHIGQLAKSPMHVAILLPLILRHGASLPDRRTDLYDAYVRIFFDREAEKPLGSDRRPGSRNPVREHRDLLVGLLRYFGWLLQSESETSRAAGQISRERLIDAAKQYLIRREKDPSLVDQLLTGVDRLYMLVSRSAGKTPDSDPFEFEVQPLREYFCARHLYAMAPTSFKGDNSTRDRTAILAALTQRPAWLNVLRFYAGCYSDGELLSIARCVEELLGDESVWTGSHVRVAGISLLRDRVLAQDGRAQRELAEAVLDSVGLRIALGRSDSGEERASELPEDGGRSVLLDRCQRELMTFPPPEYSRQLCHLISALEPSDSERWRVQLSSWWRAACADFDAVGCSEWLRVGQALDLLRFMDSSTLTEVVQRAGGLDANIATLVGAGSFSWIEAFGSRARAAIQVMLDDPAKDLQSRGPTTHALGRTASFLSAVWRLPTNVKLARRAEHLLANIDEVAELGSDAAQVVKSCTSFLHILQDELGAFQADTAYDDTINAALTAGTRVWGRHHPIFFGLAARVARVPETVDRELDPFDETIPLRAQSDYARLRYDDTIWWEHGLARAKTDLQRSWLATLLFSWAADGVLLHVSQSAQEILDGLSENQYESILQTVVAVASTQRKRADRKFVVSLLERTGQISSRMLALLSVRVNALGRLRLYQSMPQHYDGNDGAILALSLRAELGRREAKKGLNFAAIEALVVRLDRIVDLVVSDPAATNRLVEVLNSLPPDFARSWLTQPAKYPRVALEAIDSRCISSWLARTSTLSQVAQLSEWRV